MLVVGYRRQSRLARPHDVTLDAGTAAASINPLFLFMVSDNKVSFTIPKVDHIVTAIGEMASET